MVLIVCFCSLVMVSFSPWHILKICALKSLSSKSRVWASSEKTPITCFLPPYTWVALSYLFACLIYFCWKLDILNIIMCQLWETDFTSYPGFTFLNFYFLYFILFYSPRVYFWPCLGGGSRFVYWTCFLKSTFLVVGNDWSLYFVSFGVSQCLDRYYLKHLETKISSSFGR